MNEAETRADLIDPALASAGWGVAEGSAIKREYIIAPGRIEGGGRKGKGEIAHFIFWPLTYWYCWIYVLRFCRVLQFCSSLVLLSVSNAALPLVFRSANRQ